MAPLVGTVANATAGIAKRVAWANKSLHGTRTISKSRSPSPSWSDSSFLPFCFGSRGASFAVVAFAAVEANAASLPKSQTSLDPTLHRPLPLCDKTQPQATSPVQEEEEEDKTRMPMDQAVRLESVPGPTLTMVTNTTITAGTMGTPPPLVHQSMRLLRTLHRRRLKCLDNISWTIECTMVKTIEDTRPLVAHISQSPNGSPSEHFVY